MPNHCFWLKYESIIHNNASSSEKWSGLNQERNLHRSVQNGSKQIYVWILIWETTGDGLFHWRKHYGLWTHILARSDSLNVLIMDLFLTNMKLLSSQDINWWTGEVWITCGLLWCFYQLFGLSFWRHPFTAEHPLLRQWCNDTFLQIWWRNKLILILDALRVRTFSANAHFWLRWDYQYPTKLKGRKCNLL